MAFLGLLACLQERHAQLGWGPCLRPACMRSACMRGLFRGPGFGATRAAHAARLPWAKTNGASQHPHHETAVRFSLKGSGHACLQHCTCCSFMSLRHSRHHARTSMLTLLLRLQSYTHAHTPAHTCAYTNQQCLPHTTASLLKDLVSLCAAQPARMHLGRPCRSSGLLVGTTCSQTGVSCCIIVYVYMSGNAAHPPSVMPRKLITNVGAAL